MKGLLVADFDFKDNKNSGITKKVDGIYNAFIRNNVNIDLMYCEYFYTIFKTSDEDIKELSKSRKQKYKFILEKIKENNYDFIFIRYMLSNYFFVEFLKEVKKFNSKIKIIIEFPTIPYDKEIKNLSVLEIDKYFRSELKKYTDIAISYNVLGEVFGIKAISIGNGIDTSKYCILNNSEKNSTTVNLIGVGSIAKWHGYDRVIEGIKLYKEKVKEERKNIIFNVVGDGEDLGYLKSLTTKLNLETNVKFWGFKDGEELMELYNNSDVGIGALGWSRKDLKDGSALKNREYCSIGLPFIYSAEDLDFSNKFKYALKIKDTEEPVNIQEVINFIADVKSNGNYINEMRMYSEMNLDWMVKVKRILAKMACME